MEIINKKRIDDDGINYYTIKWTILFKFIF